MDAGHRAQGDHREDTMNLLLYAEARRTLTRRDLSPTTEQWIGDRLPSLPDSLFEELGYVGATAAGGSATGQADDDLDDSLDDLLHWFAAPALSYG